MRLLLVSDLTMMVMNGGGERTEEEYRALLRAAGFSRVKITPTRTAVSVIEAEPCRRDQLASRMRKRLRPRNLYTEKSL